MILSEQDRHAVHRMVSLGMPVEEVADAFGIAPGDVQRIDQREIMRKRVSMFQEIRRLRTRIAE